MKEIQLTQDKIALIDDEDFEIISLFKWYAKYDKSTNSYYAATSSSEGTRKKILMHRVIMKTPDGMVCDHINHDTLDNRKSNLRNCTRAQNNANKIVAKNNKTKYRGVSIYRNKYIATVKKTYLGIYNTPEEAADVVREKSVELFGSFYQEFTR